MAVREDSAPALRDARHAAAFAPPAYTPTESKPRGCSFAYLAGNQTSFFIVLSPLPVSLVRFRQVDGLGAEYELHPDGNSLDFFQGLVRKKLP